MVIESIRDSVRRLRSKSRLCTDLFNDVYINPIKLFWRMVWKRTKRIYSDRVYMCEFAATVYPISETERPENLVVH